MRKLLTILVALLLYGLPMAALARDRDPPQIKHQPCSEYTIGRPLEIRARIIDSSKLFDPKVIYRTAATGGWRNLTLLEVGHVYRAVIPAADLDADLEYFIEAFDIHGNGPGRCGTPESPAILTPAATTHQCNQFDGDTPPESIGTAPPPPSPSPGPLPEPEPQSEARSEPHKPSQPSPHLQPEPKQQVRRAERPNPDASDAHITRPESVEPAASSCSAADPPLYCRGWLWGVGGGLVVAAIVIGVAVGLSGGPQSIDEVSLEIIGPAPTQALVTW